MASYITNYEFGNIDIELKFHLEENLISEMEKANPHISDSNTITYVAKDAITRLIQLFSNKKFHERDLKGVIKIFFDQHNSLRIDKREKIEEVTFRALINCPSTKKSTCNIL